MSSWPKGVVRWQEDGRWHLSIPFTWLLPEAANFCLRHGDCVVGGPAVKLMPEYIGEYAEIGADRDDMLARYNPQATRTTQGCHNACPFCGVHKIEGPFRELESWEAKPILIDSNFLQCSDKHFDAVCDSLQDVRGIDYNQALDATLFSDYRARRLADLDFATLRFSWDMPNDERAVLDAIETAKSVGFAEWKIYVYCITGFREEPEEALYRVTTLRSHGAKGFPMRYQPIDALRKNDYWPPQWERKDLKNFIQYWDQFLGYGEAAKSGERPYVFPSQSNKQVRLEL